MGNPQCPHTDVRRKKHVVNGVAHLMCQPCADELSVHSPVVWTYRKPDWCERALGEDIHDLCLLREELAHTEKRCSELRDTLRNEIKRVYQRYNRSRRVSEKLTMKQMAEGMGVGIDALKAYMAWSRGEYVWTDATKVKHEANKNMARSRAARRRAGKEPVDPKPRHQ
jgi:transposase-like protein